jgi:arylsulfatase A
MNRRQFLHAAVGASAVAQSRRPPNIVLIMADDFGYECLGCNGATEYRTPKLDSLASTGVRFTAAHSTPLCTPTRVQLMTGKYNCRNYTEFGSLPPGEFTFGHMLQKSGYRTCAVGKWQLAGAIRGTNYRGNGTQPGPAGFDEHCLWQVRDRGSRYWDPILEIDGKPAATLEGKYGPDIFADFATNFIERHRSRPFLLYYPMALTHDPFVPTPRSGSAPSAGQKQRNDPKWFADMVAYMDHSAGRVIAKIDELGLDRNTLVLFTGDNGTSPAITTATRNGPYRGGKGGTTEAGTHVPLIARWSGQSPKGKVCNDLIDFTDFLPTLAEATGARIPNGHPRDGQTFLAQVQGKRGTPREWVFCHYNPRWGKRPPARWAMDKRWKLYGDRRFFDLQSDPLEEKPPLADLTPEMQTARTKLEAVLARFPG